MKKIADRMEISVEELNGIRRRTLESAKKAIVSRQDTSVTKAADISLVK